jgi:hypothetical protein
MRIRNTVDMYNFRRICVFIDLIWNKNGLIGYFYRLGKSLVESFEQTVSADNLSSSQVKFVII